MQCTARPDRDPGIYHFLEQKENMVVSKCKSRPQCSFFCHAVPYFIVWNWLKDELFVRHWNVAADIFGVLQHVIYTVWLGKDASQYWNWLFVLLHLWLMVYNIRESLRIDCRVCKSSLKDFYGLLANLIYYTSYLSWTELELKLMGHWGFYEITKSISAADQKYIGKFCRASKACLKPWVD